MHPTVLVHASHGIYTHSTCNVTHGIGTHGVCTHGIGTHGTCVYIPRCFCMLPTVYLHVSHSIYIVHPRYIPPRYITVYTVGDVPWETYAYRGSHSHIPWVTLLNVTHGICPPQNRCHPRYIIMFPTTYPPQYIPHSMSPTVYKCHPRYIYP